MKLIKNIKEPITSVIGLAIVVITIIAVHNGTITWLYEGLSGIATGAVFFLIPDQIVSLILAILTQAKDKFLGK